MGFFGLDSIYFCVGPTDRGWRRGSPYRGDGEGFIVHGEKRGAIGDLLLMVNFRQPSYEFTFNVGIDLLF
jgi:hypothetical protein